MRACRSFARLFRWSTPQPVTGCGVPFLLFPRCPFSRSNRCRQGAFVALSHAHGRLDARCETRDLPASCSAAPPCTTPGCLAIARPSLDTPLCLFSHSSTSFQPRDALRASFGCGRFQERSGPGRRHLGRSCAYPARCAECCELCVYAWMKR
ncbi:hypothetical protein BKA80DRAFT_264065 [Phyllosticta citrichinensis]